MPNSICIKSPALIGCCFGRTHGEPKERSSDAVHKIPHVPLDQNNNWNHGPQFTSRPDVITHNSTGLEGLEHIAIITIMNLKVAFVHM